MTEGAGQESMEGYADIDASGSWRRKDIGVLLRDKNAGLFNQRKIDLTLEYIDPNHAIRCAPPNALDSFF